MTFIFFTVGLVLACAFGVYVGQKDGYREGYIQGWHEAERHYRSADY